jgi:hypothetical protein
MTIFEDVISRLKADSDIIALVGSGSPLVVRVYPHDQIPQNPTYPLVTAWRIDSQRQVTIDSDGSLVNTRFQVESWAETRAVSDDLIEKCRLAMTGSSVSFKSNTAFGPIDTTDPEIDKQGNITDFSVWHR